MLLEVEDETRDFVTIYRKDFPAKQAERRKQYAQGTAFPPPLTALNGPYKKCLYTRVRNENLPLNEQTEDPQEVLDRIRENHPRFKGFLPEIIPDQNLIEKKENEVKHTRYQLDYTKGELSELQVYGKKKDIELPEDWIIAETIQRMSYKNPWKIVSKNLLYVKKAEKPPSNLVPNEKEREILRIRTGDTEYDATIDDTGSHILKTRPYGPPLATEPQIYSKGPNSTPSECSLILKEKKIALPSNVL
nr:PREDICTED: uncharacterized protein LOC105661816 [Megachile rotundata]XP_012135092.1 PREDICTED: uncharacterized protein LOC105661816 [Megachile rotundata]